MSEKYQGNCHCGAVRFSYAGEKIEKGIKCNCSICSRRAAVMTSEVIPEEAFKIDADDGALGLYQFGDKSAFHYFCTHCGVYTFHVPGRFPGHYRANTACIDGVDSYSLDFDIFDGKNLL